METEQKLGRINNEGSEDLDAEVLENGEIAIVITQEEFNYFIGKKAYKYIRKFKTFHSDGVDKFVFTWHWPGFFLGPFGFIWMAYRKLYGWSILVFLLVLIFPPISLLLPVLFGLTCNYLYYKHAKIKILNIKNKQNASNYTQMPEILQKIGGTNLSAVILPVILMVCLLGYLIYSVV